MAEPPELQEVRRHLILFFSGHTHERLRWAEGPLVQVAPWFHILCFAPGPQCGLWSYVTVGACAVREDGVAREFSVFANERSMRFVEMLAMIAYYHRDFELGPGHTVALGEPWVAGSQCDCALISAPYPLDPSFEECEVDGMTVEMLWALPITKRERDFKIEHGLEALESTFERVGLEYWDFARASVV